MPSLPTNSKSKAKDDDQMDIDVKVEAIPPTDPNVQLLKELNVHVDLLNRAVAELEERFTTRVLKSLTSTRKRLSPAVLTHSIKQNLAENNPGRSTLLSYLDQSSGPAIDVSKEESLQKSRHFEDSFPEIQSYYSLLTIVWLLDQKQNDQALSLCNSILSQVGPWNRRSLDQLAAKIYFYYSRAHELSDKFSEARNPLLDALRTATLRRDSELQATLLNLLLRNYLHYNLYDQADKLVAKSTFPENAGNNAFARYMYYLGRIKAVQLDYTESHKHLQQAIRKAPSTTAAAGFLQAVYKLSIIVQLLMGEIPERSIFRQPQLRAALIPYIHITQAVRIGDLSKFRDALTKYEAQFRRDKLETLIHRIRHNVIKAGVKMISIAYSKIPLKDICFKLHLDSEEDAQFIVAKAIRDGVIDATINHEDGYVQSKELVDVYSTNEPQSAFHQRIEFCLNLHNESVKAMRFPMDAHKKLIEASAEIREKEKEMQSDLNASLPDDEDEPMDM